tara:strand:+ start:296 stop:745 length:450 start_codon:yes stop_codon:yes gene_type:complete
MFGTHGHFDPSIKTRSNYGEQREFPSTLTNFGTAKGNYVNKNTAPFRTGFQAFTMMLEWYNDAFTMYSMLGAGSDAVHKNESNSSAHDNGDAEVVKEKVDSTVFIISEPTKTNPQQRKRISTVNYSDSAKFHNLFNDTWTITVDSVYNK